MAKPMFDADALISAFETATAQQGAQLKKAVSDATLASLQGRELTLKNIRAALKAVTDAASAGAAKNLTGGVDAEALPQIVAEVLTVPRHGVGSRMQLAQVQLQTDVVLSWTLVAIALTALGDLFFEGVVSVVAKTRSTVQRRRVDALLKRF